MQIILWQAPVVQHQLVARKSGWCLQMLVGSVLVSLMYCVDPGIYLGHLLEMGSNSQNTHFDC